jgi:hypothetical protein
MLRRVGVRCLWRSAIVTESSRRHGVTARVRLFVSRDDAGSTHAECEIEGKLLHPAAEHMVAFR